MKICTTEEAIAMSEKFIADYNDGRWSEFSDKHVMQVCEDLLMALPPGEYDRSTRGGMAWLAVVRIMGRVIPSSVHTTDQA